MANERGMTSCKAPHVPLDPAVRDETLLYIERDGVVERCVQIHPSLIVVVVVCPRGGTGGNLKGVARLASEGRGVLLLVGRREVVVEAVRGVFHAELAVGLDGEGVGVLVKREGSK